MKLPASLILGEHITQDAHDIHDAMSILLGSPGPSLRDLTNSAVSLSWPVEALIEESINAIIE